MIRALFLAAIVFFYGIPAYADALIPTPFASISPDGTHELDFTSGSFAVDWYDNEADLLADMASGNLGDNRVALCDAGSNGPQGALGSPYDLDDYVPGGTGLCSGFTGFGYLVLRNGAGFSVAQGTPDADEWSQWSDATGTRIETTSPSHNEVIATSTPFDLGATGFITEDDFVEGAKLKIDLLYNSSQIRAFSNNYVLGVGNTCIFGIGSFCFFDPTVDDATISFDIDTDGSFNVSTTTPGFDNSFKGRFSMQTRVVVPTFSFLGIEIGERTLTATSTSFVIGQLSGWDIIQDTSNDSFDAITNGDGLEACQFDMASILDFSSSTNLFGCIASMAVALVIPNQQQTLALITQAKDTFLHKAPWGYGVRVYEMFTSDIDASSLPEINFVFPDGTPIAGHSLNLTPWDLMAGPGSRLAEAEDAEGHPLLPILLNAWNAFCYFMFGMYLLRLFHKEPEDHHAHH